MTTVTISEFRNNLSEYIRRSKYKGEEFIVVDEKKNVDMVKVSPAETKSKDKDWNEYMKFVESTYGMWKGYPEDVNRKALRKTDRERLMRRQRG